MTIGDKTAYVLQGILEPISHDQRVIFTNGKIITFASNATELSGQDASGTIGATFNQILSTVQFTSSDVTADWQTYKNDTYGFSFKYPKGWILGKDERNTPTFKINPDETAQILINFEGGFEGASYYRKGEAKNNLLNITSKEDWTKNGASSNQIVLYAVNITSNNDSLFLIYNYKENKNNSAVDLFDDILSTFQFTK